MAEENRDGHSWSVHGKRNRRKGRRLTLFPLFRRFPAMRRFLSRRRSLPLALLSAASRLKPRGVRSVGRFRGLGGPDGGPLSSSMRLSAWTMPGCVQQLCVIRCGERRPSIRSAGSCGLGQYPQVFPRPVRGHLRMGPRLIRPHVLRRPAWRVPVNFTLRPETGAVAAGRQRR